MPRISGDVTQARPLPGRPPDLTSVPRQGCVFLPRCPLAADVCASAEPPDTVLADTGLGGRRFACYVAAGAAT
jgi:peptide/nickel transport system ATP-binding protein